MLYGEYISENANDTVQKNVLEITVAALYTNNIKPCMEVVVVCTKAILDEITNSIKETALHIFSDKLISVILYGSYTNDKNDAESDIDIMLLLNLPSDKIDGYRSEIAKVASRLSLESEECITISVTLQDIETFEKYQHILPFYRNVASNGVVIYAA